MIKYKIVTAKFILTRSHKDTKKGFRFRQLDSFLVLLRGFVPSCEHIVLDSE
jgi:hypothetical protein